MKPSRGTQLASCDGKRAFDTFVAAQRMAKRPHRDQCALHAYHCPTYHKYHVGSVKPRAARPQRFILDELENVDGLSS